MTPAEAQRLAREKNLDLVEVAPGARPPVCRIMDYGKYRYDQSKKERQSRKNQRVTKIKEVKMSPKIDVNDFGVRVKRAAEFLQKGYKVKATVRFRGREIVHSDIGRRLIEDLARHVGEYGSMQDPPKVEGRNMSTIIAPRE